MRNKLNLKRYSLYEQMGIPMPDACTPYYFINHLRRIVIDYWMGDHVDKERYAMCNYFVTKDIAEKFHSEIQQRGDTVDNRRNILMEIYNVHPNGKRGDPYWKRRYRP